MISLTFGVVINIKNVEVMKALGRRLRDLRISQRLSQKRLAELSDVHISQISRVERGEVNVTISTIHALAEGLGVSVVELIIDQ